MSRNSSSRPDSTPDMMTHAPDGPSQPHGLRHDETRANDMPPICDQPFLLPLPDLDATQDFAQALAALAQPGDCFLLEGPIGAGKSALARSFIQTRMAAHDRIEDVPSPTFTLVQVYDLPGGEIWHADLYRLTHPDEALELGLDEAMEDAICLIEWPDRLGSAAPAHAMRIALASPDRADTPAPEQIPDSRLARITLPRTARAALTDAIRRLLA